MWFFAILITLSTLVFAQGNSPVLDPNKFTVCAITINSDDEKKIFQAQAAKNPKKFNPVVELTDFGENDWFAKACSSGVRCDQLVISGHFAGDFFGEDSDKSLSLTELEKAGCSKSCEGILNQPYEVFLFGCNTLAEKNEDHRTPAQYLQVLLQDGIPLARAELVVQSRYGAVGDSNKAGMLRAFAGEAKQLYGFHSVGPSGKNVKGFINNYFSKISAADHLEKQMAKRMLNKVDMANKTLADSLKSTAFTQCASIDAKDEKTKKLCGLFDERKTNSEKLDLTLELLSQEDYLLYLPAISIFMDDLQAIPLTEEEQKSLDLLKNNNVLKNQILGLIGQTKELGLKSQWAILAGNIGYLSKEETSQILTQEVEKIFAKPLSEADVGLICSLDSEITDKIKLSDKNIKNRSVREQELWAFSCLSPLHDADLLNRLINTKLGNNPEILDLQMELAAYSDVVELNIPSSLKIYAKNKIGNKDIDQAGEALDFIAKFFPDDQDGIKKAFQLIEQNPDREQSFYGYNAFANMQTKDTALLNKALAQIQKPVGSDNELIKFIVNSKSLDPKIEHGFSALLNIDHVDEYDKQAILDHMLEMKPSNPAVIDEVLKYSENKNAFFRYEAMNLLKTFDLSPDQKQRLDKIP